MKDTPSRLARTGSAFMRSLIGLVFTLAVIFVGYKRFFSQLSSTGAGGGASAVRSVEVTGVENDLVAIAQSERMYQAEHGSYASLEELHSSGAMAVAKTGREGYRYEAEASGNSFRV